ncbi:MAG: hypothetical protein C0403_15625 [Desulfobacterium sp.]|nr:hypothetical protein [Desulfobacterium sp.]
MENILNKMRPFVSKYINGLLKSIKQARQPQKKIDLFLNLSTICNYNCIFCNRNVTKKIIRLHEIVNINEFAEHARMVDITGYGEITCHPDFLEIIRFFYNKNIAIRFVTNGSKLTKESADYLVRSKIFEIVISLNSLTPETYTRLHGDHTSLANTLENIEYLFSLPHNFPIRLSFVITSYNLHEIPNFIQYAKKNRAASISCLGLTPTLQHMYPADLIVDNTKKDREFLDSMRELAKSEGVEAYICQLENQSTPEIPIDPARLKEMIKSCDWVYNKFFIEPDGKVAPCCWSRINLGNIKEKSFNEIWLGKPYKNLRKKIKTGISPSCQNCRRLN